ncbi:histidine phosphatase superfamily [Thelonectria olida]|uniref:3-phytase n=1 Tax=Thelonectria olida TaxID=1576542 RepID=A0A9P8W677_9HYPO|nr:histidine phosphatase superfamily [Thelonectria olida]
MTTLVPRPPYSESELSSLYPPQLRLQQVQILLRHGERTPITARFRNADLPAFWPYCSAARRLSSAILDPNDGNALTSLQWQRRLETFSHQNDAAVIASGPAAELDAICDMGMLTDRGRETTTFLGQRLRHLYVDQLAFLPATLADGFPIYLRATPVPRALDSLQQTFHGLYPPSLRAADLPPPTILVRSPADETLFPNDGNCRRFAELARAFAQRAAVRWNDTDDMAFLTKKLGKWMPEDNPRVAVDSHPRLSGLMDTINATNAHGPATKLPKEFYDPEVKRIIEKIGVEEWYAGYKESEEYRTLGIGGLLGDVVARMVGSAEHSTADGEYELASLKGATAPVRFGMSGCHDTTLAGALASLGAYDTEAWPPFTSHIAIELFRHANQPPASPPKPSSSNSLLSSWFGWAAKSSSAAGSPPPGIGRKKTPELTKDEKAHLQGYYVRLRYNDRPVTIPGCKPAGKHLEGDESFCTLEAFKAIVDKFTPQNWKQQCRSNIKEPAFPAKPEPAGY